MPLAAVMETGLRLTDRDRELLASVYWHGCLTTDELRVLFFPGHRGAQRRLAWLAEQRFLDRFYPVEPRRRGRTQARFVLGEAGAYVVAALLGVRLKDLSWHGLDSLGAPTVYQHQRGVNRFFVSLAEAGRKRPGQGLARWASAKECLRLFGERVGNQEILPAIRPDGWGVYLCRRGGVPFFLELDRGTESGVVLERKVIKYLRHHREHPDDRLTVLFLPPSARVGASIRESIRRAVAREARLEGIQCGSEISFWVRAETADTSPLDWVWEEVAGGRRVRMVEMPASPTPGLTVEDCLGVKWQRWARDMGGTV